MKSHKYLFIYLFIYFLFNGGLSFNAKSFNLLTLVNKIIIDLIKKSYKPHTLWMFVFLIYTNM